MTNTVLGRLRAVGIAEGVSFLVLLGIAMPLKYLAGQPLMVKVVGWAHGVLFVGYVLAVFQAAAVYRWPLMRTGVALVASLLPFGTFALEPRWRREELEGPPMSPNPVE